jgi:formamidopyrimidine-DNA glycosylase
MPELPEVETIARTLRGAGPTDQSILEQRIESAKLLWERTLVTPSPAEFERRIVNQSIEDISRRGKYLVLKLSHDSLLIHLGMSGDLLVGIYNQAPDGHVRMRLNFESGRQLNFNDPRKFGRVWLTSEPQAVLSRLGPEPMDPSFTAESLYQRLKSHHRQLKPLLLDQTFIAGLGNIYTDEALHLAKIHPLTIADTLDIDQAERLWRSIRQVLEEGIQRNGASIDWVYRGGEFQNYFRVYQRTGEACPECGTIIERIIVGQRGTHICPKCQPLKNARHA